MVATVENPWLMSIRWQDHQLLMVDNIWAQVPWFLITFGYTGLVCLSESSTAGLISELELWLDIFDLSIHTLSARAVDQFRIGITWKRFSGVTLVAWERPFDGCLEVMNVLLKPSLKGAQYASFNTIPVVWEKSSSFQPPFGMAINSSSKNNKCRMGLSKNGVSLKLMFSLFLVLASVGWWVVTGQTHVVDLFMDWCRSATLLSSNCRWFQACPKPRCQIESFPPVNKN